MSEQTHPCPAHLAHLVGNQFSPEPEHQEEEKMPWERETLGRSQRSWGLAGQVEVGMGTGHTG